MNAEFFGPDSLTSTDFHLREISLIFSIFRERISTRNAPATCFSSKQTKSLTKAIFLRFSLSFHFSVPKTISMITEFMHEELIIDAFALGMNNHLL